MGEWSGALLFASGPNKVGGPKVERGGFRPHLVCAFSFLFFSFLSWSRPAQDA